MIELKEEQRVEVVAAISWSRLGNGRKRLDKQRGTVKKLNPTGTPGNLFPKDQWLIDVLLDSGELHCIFAFHLRPLSILELIAEAANG